MEDLANIKGKNIVISIPISALKYAAEMAFGKYPSLSEYRVTDAKAFAEALCGELNTEEENGDTPVHRMLDAACLSALDSGCEGIEP